MAAESRCAAAATSQRAHVRHVARRCLAALPLRLLTGQGSLPTPARRASPPGGCCQRRATAHERRRRGWWYGCAQGRNGRGGGSSGSHGKQWRQRRPCGRTVARHLRAVGRDPPAAPSADSGRAAGAPREDSQGPHGARSSLFRGIARILGLACRCSGTPPPLALHEGSPQCPCGWWAAGPSSGWCCTA